MPRSASIYHCTSEPLHFVGRRAELALLDEALAGGMASVIALVGPGGQGKTAIVQHWLQTVVARQDVDGVFLWSFYRGKDSDLCLRELFAYAEGLAAAPEVSASFCVDRLLPRLRNERWALVFDGAEVVQHETGVWAGRFVHPELGRLVEELASAPLPGVAVVTTRFSVPTLVGRRHARVLSLSTLDVESAVALLRSLGVRGGDDVCEAAARAAGLHAKAVELLGTWLVRFHAGDAARHDRLPSLAANAADVSDEERHVLRVLDVFHTALPPEQKDILALATAFRQPPTEARLAEYLVSQPVRRLLHEEHRRAYQPFAERPAWIPAQIDELVDLRLLERVREARLDALVLDTHPLVRRGFEDVLGGPADGAAAHGAAAHGAAAHGAAARAGFLRGRPDRRPPRTLAEAREEVELFHAYCEAGLWSEADGTLAALDNPKHRFLAPAFERDLLLRFFPSGAWTQPPSWPGFGRWRSLAICFEMLGQFDEAIAAYRPQDAALQGDALIALGRLGPLLERANVPHPWQTLWQAYRAHALALAGRNDEALRLAQSTVPLDVYEWVHIFEALLRLGRLDALDLHSMLYRPPLLEEHPWSALARRRMRADYTRIRGGETSLDLAPEYGAILAEYDRAGLPLERVLTRLSYARWLWDTFATCPSPQVDEAGTLQRGALELARRFGMAALEIDALELAADIADRRGRPDPNLRSTIIALRKERGLHGAVRP